MKILIRIGKEVFDFFCGDWRIFWGVSITIVLVSLIGRLAIKEYTGPVAGIIFILGIALSLVSALAREIPVHRLS